MGRIKRCRAAALASPLVAVSLVGPIVHNLARAGESDPFKVAPEQTGQQRVLVHVTLNGVDAGEHLVDVDGDTVSVPAATLHTLRINQFGDAAVPLRQGGALGFHFDPQSSALTLTAAPEMFDVQRFAPDWTGRDVHLSPEEWGALVDYDLNARTPIGGGRGFASGSAAIGGVADLRLLGPNIFGSLGWAYDSSRPNGAALVRLDSYVTWRPANDNLAVSAGDLLPTLDTETTARAYRFFGVQIGTDHSGAIGWSSAPIASVSGSAQAQSVLDLYLNGQRSFSTTTAGGPFALTLPPGAGGSANVVMTDVSGRQMLVPVDVPLVDAQMLRKGLLLWSAGAGAPRFGFGTSSSSYLPDLYGYGTLRYGAFERATMRLHGEFGANLALVELGTDAIVTPGLAARATIALSKSDRGVGGMARLAVSAVGPWGLAAEAAVSQTAGRFDDVVSASGRIYATQHRLSTAFTLPSTAAYSGRLSWQATTNLAFSTAYELERFPSAGRVGIVSVNANTTVADLPVFANVFHNLGGRRSTTALVGVSFQLGTVQGSASAGLGNDQSQRSGARASGSFNVADPLREEVGATGWNAFGSYGPSGNVAGAQIEHRTGYGVAGLAVQNFGSSVTGLATLRGSAGVVGWHPFVADPAQGGIIVVDAGRPSVPVQLNGFDRGVTSFDGKIALTGAVAGVPHRISIDTTALPLDSVPSVTDGEAILRNGGATSLVLRVSPSTTAASMTVLLDGAPPALGSVIVGAQSSAPIGKDGRTYLPTIEPGEVLRVDLPDGRSCHVHTKFDGQGGVGRRLGTLPCQDVGG